MFSVLAADGPPGFRSTLRKYRSAGCSRCEGAALLYGENPELQAPDRQPAGKRIEGQRLARAAERDPPGSELLAPRHGCRRWHEAFAPAVAQPGPGCPARRGDGQKSYVAEEGNSRACLGLGCFDWESLPSGVVRFMLVSEKKHKDN